MIIYLNRAGRPTVKFEFPGPIEQMRKDMQDGLKATIEPQGEEYRVRIYDGDIRTHDFTAKREQKLLKL